MYNSDYSLAAGLGAGLIIIWLITFVICIFMIASWWKIFKKANQPGWAAIIPIYNIIVMLQVAELPLWYIILYIIPIANIIIPFVVNINIAKKFGKTAGFGILMTLIPIIGVPMLGFGSNEYKKN